MSTHKKPDRLVPGVLGGMGPAATCDFISQVIKATTAQVDQDHIRMLIDHNPLVPNRQAAVLRCDATPADMLVAMARRLEEMGAEFLVMPCNSSHAYASQIEESVSIPLISIVDETIRSTEDLNSIGVLATDGCLRSGLYQAKIEEAGKRAVLPNGDEIHVLMECITRIKSGITDRSVSDPMYAVGLELVNRGADVLVAGCTEIPLVLKSDDLPRPVISSTKALAEATVAIALGNRK